MDFQLLEELADGDDQSAAFSELIEQGFGHDGGCCGHQNRIEGRRFGPAPVAVAMAQRDGVVTESPQGLASANRQ